MDTYNVTFLPDDIQVTAEKGMSLMDAAIKAGVPINNVCGGDGVCGKCRVIIKSGNVEAKPNIFLTRDDIQADVALACQTYVEGDVVVEVPLESQTKGAPKLASEDAIRFGKVSELVGEDGRFSHHPLAKKVFMQLPKPTIDDCISDQERVFRELRKEKDIPVMQMGLSILKMLPATLRENDWKVTALLGRRGGTVEVIDVVGGDGSKENYGVAIDVGTTTLAAHLVDLSTSDTIATKAKYNSQISLGDDVIARMMYASDDVKRQKMQDMIVNDINDLIAGLVMEADVKLHDVNYIVASGNTTMIHFLYGLDTANVRREPYVPCSFMPPVIRAAEVGISINPRGLLTAVPCVASYVGGDIVSDVLVTGMTESDSVTMLIDMGTNGELVLGNSDWLITCSASAGPAFEGGGISCGMRATAGAIEKVELGKGGVIQECSVVGGGKPLGICGSGLIDIVGQLVEVGCIDRRGRYIAEECGDLLRENDDGDKEFLLIPGEETILGRDIVLTEADLNNLIHTKGSIYMAAECLVDYMGMSFGDVETIYVAGGFGNYLRVEQAVAIGLLPDLEHDKFHFVGNGSVQGAKMALLSDDAYSYLDQSIAEKMTHLELSTYHKYMNEYSSCLFLPHTDIEKFPSMSKN